MKITLINIQNELSSNNDVSSILASVLYLMKKQYPHYEDWFTNKVINGLEKNERNIIAVARKNKIIGFVNLKKTNKECKMSNIYINSKFNYEKILNRLIDESLEWLQVKNPTIILSDVELTKAFNTVLKRKWSVTDKKNHDYIINGNNNDFIRIEKKLSRKKTSK